MLIPSFKQRLIELIGDASVSSVSPEWDMGNLGVIHRLAGWLENLGFSIRIQQLSDQKANLIAQFGQGQGGLVLSGHTDTVPFNESRWQSDPLKLTEKDNRFYGLGTCDMKGFFSFVIEAFCRLDKGHIQRPLYIVATCDEESSMHGAKSLQKIHFNRPDAVIIGEPTSLKPIRMHKSMMMNAIKITGQSGHSSDPSLGKNALDTMHDVITALKAFRDNLKQNHHQTEFTVAFPTLNFGCIHGGDNPNRICNSCELHFDFRGLPHMYNDDIRQQIMNSIQPIAEKAGVAITLSPLFDGVEAFEQEKLSDLVQYSETLCQTEAQAVAFATEAPFYKQMGIDTLVLGPGSINQAHQPDEFLAFDQIKPGVNIIEQLIRRYCF